MTCRSRPCGRKSAKIRQSPAPAKASGVRQVPSGDNCGCRCWKPVRSRRTTIRCSCLSWLTWNRVTGAPSASTIRNAYSPGCPATGAPLSWRRVYPSAATASPPGPPDAVAAWSVPWPPAASWPAAPSPPAISWPLGEVVAGSARAPAPYAAANTTPRTRVNAPSLVGTFIGSGHQLVAGLVDGGADRVGVDGLFAGDRAGGRVDVDRADPGQGTDLGLDAAAQVLAEQLHRERLQRPGGGGDLGEDVDAVLVLLDHPLQPADLALDAA